MWHNGPFRASWEFQPFEWRPGLCSKKKRKARKGVDSGGGVRACWGVQDEGRSIA